MKTIVICGSMKFKEEIKQVKKELETQGFSVLLPTECMEGRPKEEASYAHFNRIQNDQTEAILVVNNNKEGIENYIGPNTFAEIAFAFYFKKKIFLLNKIYEPYQDELIGWGSIPLENNLDKLTRYL